MNAVQNAYSNFLKSRIKLRIEFLVNYTSVFPQLIVAENVDYLKSINLLETEFNELEATLKKVNDIEENIGDLLKKASLEVY